MTAQVKVNEFLQAVKERRTVYGIGKASPISDARIEEIVSEAVKYAPSAFNSQSARIVVLFGDHHDKFWDITRNTLRKLVTGDFSQTDEKISGFQRGYATILFFEDQAVVKSLQSKFPRYKDNFPVWSQHSSGMLQYIIWTALEAEGLGANLQHYNPVIDNEVKQTWNIPEEWMLIAQMPFGEKLAEPGAKEFQPLETRVRFVK
ncbi:MAG: nitroreductase family protein [Negativicutes bacterium]|nr:nitroreductase family protein [Negativicutes bacterium]